MKNIGYKDVDIYVRTLIFEALVLQTKENMDCIVQRNKGAHAAPVFHVSAIHNPKQKEIRNDAEG